MKFNLIGPFIRNAPFGTEIAFAKGLEKDGHTVFRIEPESNRQDINTSVDATIIFKDADQTTKDIISKISGLKIVYQPDDLRFTHIQQMMRDMRSVCDRAFVFDYTGIDLAKDLGYINPERLLLTADNELYKHIPNMQKDLDVCFVGSLTGGANHASRRKMVDIVSKMKGIRFGVASDLYDIGEIVRIYNRSKIVLNHATDVGQPFGFGYGYQCRHFEAGFTEACILSNKISECDITWFPQFDSEQMLIEHINYLLKNDDTRKGYAQKLYDDLYAHHLPIDRAKQIVDYVKRNQ